MKLYVLNTGWMITPDGNVLARFNTKYTKLVIPVPVYLICHPSEGLILIDTGYNWGRLPEGMKETITTSPSFDIRAQIGQLGYNASDVRHVILSHLHFDHSGHIDDFKDAMFHLRKAELDAALNRVSPDYFYQDYCHLPGYPISYIPDDGDYDLFGDGSIICLDMKGHSAGNQSFLINLPNTGKVLLTVDAAHLPQYLDTDSLIKGSWDEDLCRTAIQRVKSLKEECALTIYGHDPSMMEDVNMSPKFYD